MDKKIKLGFWNYAPFGVLPNKDVVKDWVELGSNLPMSFVFDYQKNKKEEMIELLDECQKHHLKMIIFDTRTQFRNLHSMTKEEYRRLVKAAFDDFGHHEAAFGFSIGDEPSPEEIGLFIDAMNIVKEEMPELTPFGNLIPYFGSDCNVGLDLPKEEYYKGLVDRILKESHPPIIGYDQYSQMFDSYQDQRRGIDGYFYGLDCYYEVTKRYDIPFYISLLSVGHWLYRVPSEDDIRWQIYTALAHGARGIIWFYVHQIDHDYSYRNAPYTNFGMKKTPMFDVIARQQYLFKVAYEEQLNKMELINVYHVNHVYDSRIKVEKDEYINELTIDRKLPAIISYYKEFDSEKKWVSFVNASQQLASIFRVTFKGGHKETFWLAPGEMRLFDLEEVAK